jgi:cytochrome c oxidase assembly factor CtaG
VGDLGSVVGGSVPFVLNSDWVWTLLGAAVVYLVLARWGVREPWPGWRTRCFLGGLAVMGVAMVSPLDNYDVVSLLAHTTQHLLIAFAAAPLLAMGSPLRLIRASLPDRPRSVADRLARSKAGSLVTRPVVAWSVFVVAVVATHVPPMFRAALENGKVHDLQHAVYLLGGILFWLPVVGGDSPWRALGQAQRVRSVGGAALVLGGLDLVALSRAAPMYRYYSALPSPWGRHAALVAQHQTALLVVVFLAAVVTAVDVSGRALLRR